MKIRKITIKDEESPANSELVGYIDLGTPFLDVPERVVKLCTACNVTKLVTPDNKYAITLRAASPTMINVAGALALAHAELVDFLQKFCTQKIRNAY